MAIWFVLASFGAWNGGGLSPPRVDRREVLRRTGAPDWIADPLIDSFETAALAAMKKKAKAKD